MFPLPSKFIAEKYDFPAWKILNKGNEPYS